MLFVRRQELLHPFIHTKYILIVGAKVYVSRMDYVIFMYVTFHTSVKNMLLFVADRLNKF